MKNNELSNYVFRVNERIREIWLYAEENSYPELATKVNFVAFPNQNNGTVEILFHERENKVFRFDKDGCEQLELYLDSVYNEIEAWVEN
ncbi:MAG TPA: hypothetical protein PLP33_29165 [Leptospiraceae bacterium]|nr:hypothetical protein [Leptospiraceae bacterium]